MRRAAVLLWIVLGACDDADADAETDGATLDAAPEDATLPDAANDGPLPDAPPPDGPPPEWAPPLIEWAPCELPGVGTGGCADVLVPADWAEPGGPTLEVHLSRVAAPPDPFDPSPRGQIWALAGGPGQPGSDWAGAAPLFAQLAPGYDLYMLDFRGTGGSSYLACDLELDEPGRARCIERLQAAWGDLLPHFTVTASSRDLGELIEALRPDGAPVLVVGASFGTYWANRYLQLYPDQPTAVVLDSLCAPGRCDYSEFQARAANEVARTFFGLCAADEVCNARLGGDPWAFVGALHERVAAGGHCPPLETDGVGLRDYLAMTLFDPRARDFLPAVLYRFARCEAGDVAAIEHFNEVAFGATGGVNGGWSDALRFHVATSELLPDPPPTVEQMEAVDATLYAATRESVVLAWLAERWPRYPRDAWVGGFAGTDVPILMLNGTLDPATSPRVAEGFAEAFTGAHQHYVLLANVAHGTLGNGCAQALLRAFVADPRGALDAGCAATAAPPPDLSPTEGRSRTWFGTDDPWDDPAE